MELLLRDFVQPLKRANHKKNEDTLLDAVLFDLSDFNKGAVSRAFYQQMSSNKKSNKQSTSQCATVDQKKHGDLN